MRMIRIPSLAALAAMLSVLAATSTARAAEVAEKITVDVTTCRVSEAALKKLGFDWIGASHSDEPIETGKVPGPSRSSETAVRMRGSLLPAQFDVFKRALEREGIAMTALPSVKVRDEVRIDSPVKNVHRGFTLGLRPEATGIWVSLKNSEPPQSLYTTYNNILYAQPASEVAGYELYFVSVSTLAALKSPPDSKIPQIKIAAAIVEMPESNYEQHQAALDEAMRAGDLKRLGKFQKEGLSVQSFPRLTARDGQHAIIQIVREFRYATEYDHEAGGVLTPAAFETANLGLELPVTATLVDGGIQLDGQLIVRIFEGFTQSERGTFAPALQATEAHFLRTLKDGQPAGFWLPGARTVRENAAGLEALRGHPATAKPGSTTEEKVRSKLGIIVTAKSVVEEPHPADDAQVKVKGYDATAALASAAKAEESAFAKAGRIMIPSVEFRDAELRDALDVIKRKSAEFDSETDPNRRGISLVLKLKNGAVPSAKVTLSLENVSVLDALRAVAKTAGLEVHDDQWALSLR